MKKVDRIPHNAEILLVGREGELILQQRDNKPGITNPGLVTTFGGGLEHGETALEAAYRELHEETSLDIAKERFVQYGPYQKTRATHGEDWTVTYFVVKDVDYEGMQVFEGERYVVVRSREELQQYATSKLFQELADDWYSGWRDFLFMPDPPLHVVDEVVEEMSCSMSAIDASHHPVIFCPVGLVGSGKTSIVSAALKIAKVPYYQISSDRIRTMFYDKGYNFQPVVDSVVSRLVDLAIERRVNIFFDNNAGSKLDTIQRINRAGYRVMTFYVNPPEEYIINKLKHLSWDSVPERFTFFKLPRHVLSSYRSNKERSKVANAQFLEEYPPDFVIHPESPDQKLVEEIAASIVNSTSDNIGLTDQTAHETHKVIAEELKQ